MSLLQKFPEYLKEHLENSFYGGALGDALGFLVELQSPEDIFIFSQKLAEDKEGSIQWLKTLQAEDWITHEKYHSGQISDDTQLTLLLMEALSEGGSEKYRVLFREKLASVFQKKKIYSYGHTTQSVSRFYLRNSKTPKGSRSSTSNGSVMRIAPLGVYFSDDLNLVAKEAYAHSQDTHAHPIPCSASQAQAIAIALLIQGRSITSTKDKINFIQEISEFLDHTEAKVLYLTLLLLLEKPFEEAKKMILELDKQQSAGMQNGGISMHAMTCTMWSHYCFLNTPNDYWNTITNAISIGGDVDTVASMAGSLSGLYNHGQGLPSWSKEWVRNMV